MDPLSLYNSTIINDLVTRVFPGSGLTGNTFLFFVLISWLVGYAGMTWNNKNNNWKTENTLTKHIWAITAGAVGYIQVILLIELVGTIYFLFSNQIISLVKNSFDLFNIIFVVIYVFAFIYFADRQKKDYYKSFNRFILINLFMLPIIAILSASFMVAKISFQLSVPFFLFGLFLIVFFGQTLISILKKLNK